MTGWVYAAWATRIPSIKDELGLSDGALALAILGLEAGAIVGLPLAGALVARVGSRRALRLGFAGLPTALFAVALTPGLFTLAAVLAGMAAATSVVDVAMNAQGIELERRYHRPVLSGLHAGHPFGLVIGGIAGTAAAAADVSVTMHFAMAGGVALGAAMVATVVLVREPAPAGQPVFVRPSRRLMLLGFIAFCAFLLDGAAYTWSAVHLRTAYDGFHGSGGGRVHRVRGRARGRTRVRRPAGGPLGTGSGGAALRGRGRGRQRRGHGRAHSRHGHRGLGVVRARARPAGPDRAGSGRPHQQRRTRRGDRRRHDDRLPRIVHRTARDPEH